MDGKLYWDGGCVSNTPLDAVIVFLIDLWDAAGPPPQTMNAVLWRAKQIQYASRTAHQVDAVATKVNLRHAVGLLKEAGVPDVAAGPLHAAGSYISENARPSGNSYLHGHRRVSASRRQTKPFVARWGPR